MDCRPWTVRACSWRGVSRIDVHLVAGVLRELCDLGHGLAEAHKALSTEVMGKGQGLYELLDAHQAAGVAVAVEALDVRGEGGEELGDVTQAGLDVLLDLIRKLQLYLADPGRVVSVMGPMGSEERDGVRINRCNENILPTASVAGPIEQPQPPWQGAQAAQVSHLLAQGRDVPGGLDDPLPAVVVLVELVTEALEHGCVLISHQRSLGATALGIAPEVPLLA